MKIICVGRNYADHAIELGNKIPSEPVIFMKPQSALYQGHNPLYYPDFTNELHYETELVYRICKNGKYISRNKAPLYYDSVGLGIDFTARDVQDNCKKNGLPWEKAKSFDNSAVVGRLHPVADFVNARSLQFSMQLNGETVQQGDSSDMLFNIDELIAHISGFFTLNIGDLIFTGTPAGVGECTVGDQLEGFFMGESNFSVTIK